MKKHPLVLGILGNLVAAIIIALVLFLKRDLLIVSVPLWSLLLLILLLSIAIFWLVFLLYHKPKQLFLLISQSLDKQYVGSVVQEFVLELDLMGFQTVLMIPSFLSPESQRKWLREILKSKNSFAGGFIIPVGGDDRQDLLLEFLDKFNKPVVLFDAPPEIKSEKYPPNAAFVGFDNKQGGELAAKAMVYELQKLKVEEPRILVIATKIVPDRQESFESYIHANTKSAEVIIVNQGDFTRESGRKIYKEILDEANNEFDKFNGIYCTNDEMALGVLGYMNELPDFPKKEIVVIGYDANVEMCALIECNSSSAKNSVDQDQKELVQACAETFINLSKEKEVEKQTLLQLSLCKTILI